MMKARFELDLNREEATKFALNLLKELDENPGAQLITVSVFAKYYEIDVAKPK